MDPPKGSLTGCWANTGDVCSPDRSSPMNGRAEISLKAIPDSVPRARRFILALEWADGASHERLAILTTEVVTNAVLHAGTGFLVRATELPGGIRVAVTDRSTSPPVMQDYGPNSPTGRGLHIVDAMADRWGVDPTDSGKTVWFEVDNEVEPV